MDAPLLALDVGATKVACAIGRAHAVSGELELLGTSLVAYPTIPHGWLGDPLMVSQAIEQALEATGVQEACHRAVVAMRPPALTRERVQTAITLADEPITVRMHDLDRLKSHALDQMLGVDREPLLIERLACRGNGFEGIRDPRGLSATTLQGLFHVIAMPMAARRAVVQVVEAAGLDVAHLSSTLPAALAGAGEKVRMKARVLLIDVGGWMTDIGLFVEGILHDSEAVPCGGVRLAAAMATTLRVTMDEAMRLSREGVASKRPDVREMVTEHWENLQHALTLILKGHPLPDVAVVTGRGALTDGFVEWVERTTGIATVLGRSARLKKTGDLACQVGSSVAVGLLELLVGASERARPRTRSPHLLNRLVDRTRAILVDYF